MIHSLFKLINIVVIYVRPSFYTCKTTLSSPHRSIMDSNFVRRKADGDADDGGSRGSKSRKHHRDRDFRDRSRSRSRSPRRGHHESSSRDRSSGKKSREGRSSGKRSPRTPEKHSAAAHSPSSKKSKKHRHRYGLMAISTYEISSTWAAFDDSVFNRRMVLRLQYMYM